MNNNEMPYTGSCACHTSHRTTITLPWLTSPHTINDNNYSMCVLGEVSFLDLVENMIREIMPTLATHTAIC